MESKVIEKKRGFVMKKLIGILFLVSFVLCGCGVENIFGTAEQRVTWFAIFAVVIVSALWLGKGE